MKNGKDSLRVLITGASTGIGAATARRLGKRGAHVALVARRKELLDEVAAAVESAGGKAHVIAADLTNPDACEKVVAEAVQALGGLDVLVNNAGMAHSKPVEKQPPKRMNTMIDLNIRAPFILCHFAIPHLKESGRGCIINIASVVGHVAFPGMAVYSATKHALVGFSEALSAELAPHKIAVCVVSPGLVDTPMAENFPSPSKGISADTVARTIESLIDRPRLHTFVPAAMEGLSIAKRLAPRAITQGIKMYGRMRGR